MNVCKCKAVRNWQNSIGVKIISLDQNVVSNLVNNGSEPFWRDLREQLLAGVKEGKLLCPIPKETILETIPRGRENRIRIRNLLEQLSFGFSFKSFGTIEGEETLALVRSGVSTCPYERIVWLSAENDALTQAVAKESQKAKEVMRCRMDAFVPGPGQNNRTVKEIRCAVMASRAAALFRQVERLIADEPLDPSDDLQLELCRLLISRGVTKAELKALREKILTHRWEAIPVVFFAAALGALLDHGRIRGRKYQVSDEVDVLRTATALHSAAMMITESPMTHLARQLGKELGESLDVFAINEREAIKATLEIALAA